jgi:hypothetical protein
VHQTLAVHQTRHIKPNSSNLRHRTHDIKPCTGAAGARRLYTAENSGSLLVWESISGKSSVFEARDRDKPQITCLACVGETDLWAGTATGDLAVYNMTTAEMLLKPWLAHKVNIL